MTAGEAKRILGFTLIELLVTLAVASILATIAVPGFQKMIHDNRLVTDHNSILVGLTHARNEAIARREDVYFTLESEATGGWRYQVIMDGAALKVHEERSSPVTPSGDGTVMFNSLGRLTASATCKTLTLTLSDSSKSLYVWRTGHIGSESCNG
ncbi:MAG: GspH/FimT family pseudopilin [Halomonas sp.]|nr:GspH/FimT family pseudopilin [Halomonas sp.]